MRFRWTDDAPALHFIVEGHGRPILLIHELGGSLRSWDRVAELLKADYRAIRYDQRGFGWSEKPRTQYSQEDLAEDALRVLDAAGVSSPVTVAATASACATAAVLARRAPGRVAGLVLLSPGFGVSGAAREATFQRADLTAEKGMAAIVDQAMNGMYPPVLRNDDFAAYRARFLACDPFAFAVANRAFAAASVVLEDVAVPVLLAPGVLDVRPVSAAMEAVAALRHGHVIPIEGAGHIPPVQNPAEVARLIAEFAPATPSGLTGKI